MEMVEFIYKPTLRRVNDTRSLLVISTVNSTQNVHTPTSLSSISSVPLRYVIESVVPSWPLITGK